MCLQLINCIVLGSNLEPLRFATIKRLFTTIVVFEQQIEYIVPLTWGIP